MCSAEKMHYKYVFVILVYRNTEDIVECLSSIRDKVSDYKVVIVNSYYDEATKNAFSDIAKRESCDFINVENRSYGAGNNRGIEFARQNYDFDYIVLSNPDIIIKEFSDKAVEYNKDAVIAPILRTVNGKNQNPYWLKKNRFAEWLLYCGQKRNNRFIYFSGVAINKLIREVGLRTFLASKKSSRRIYAAHGSFVLFPSSLFDKTGLFYDENMFLFCEEAYISHIFENVGVETVLVKDIVISHKEDGSVSLSPIDENSEERKSFVYYYEKLYKNKK